MAGKNQDNNTTNSKENLWGGILNDIAHAGSDETAAITDRMAKINEILNAAHASESASDQHNFGLSEIEKSDLVLAKYVFSKGGKEPDDWDDLWELMKT
ncbi:hypothetical protein RUND412_006939 [Rhizina undulata]